MRLRATRLTSISTALRKFWGPSMLFGVSDIGTWQTTDLPTIYQDSIGTTPVVAPSNPVGLRLDKRLGLVLGPELVANGDFSSDMIWIKPTGVLITGGVASATAASGDFYQSCSSTAAGKMYKITYTLSGVMAGSVQFKFYSGNYNGETRSANGTFTETVPIGSALIALNIGWALSGFTGTIDNISVRELPGNHATQATTTARPAYRATPIPYVDYDGVDDVMVTTFPSSLGSNCTVATAIPSVGAVILTGQTLGTTYSDNSDNRELLIINRALTASETTLLTNYLNYRSF